MLRAAGAGALGYPPSVMRKFALVAFTLVLLSLVAACGAGSTRVPEGRPDIVLVIWDTVRADRMSVYGHEIETTPHADAWAQGARVFEDCISVSSTTVPSHASLFTGLMPGEHGSDNTRPKLPDSVATLAEELGAAGYRTYLFSANPFVSAATGLARGFDVVEHPWDPALRQAARGIVARKIADAGGQALVGKGSARAEGARWGLGSAGALALPALLTWLAAEDELPVFVVLNYMEAHQPLLPDPRFLELAMDEATRARWRASDRTFERMRAFTFGLAEIEDGELRAMTAAYDAALMELDSHFRGLLEGLAELERGRELAMILTSDHGEHLGEHHMLDHQFSLYDPLLRVPLIVKAPGFEPGRDSTPVSLVDLHTTLRALAGLEGGGVSSGSPAPPLGSGPSGRARVAEYPAAPEKQIAPFERAHREWDPEPWRRSWRSLHSGGWKLRVASDGAVHLHDLSADPGEEVDLSTREPLVRDELVRQLESLLSAYRDPQGREGKTELPDDLRERLESLGYAAGGS